MDDPWATLFCHPEIEAKYQLNVTVAPQVYKQKDTSGVHHYGCEREIVARTSSTTLIQDHLLLKLTVSIEEKINYTRICRFNNKMLVRIQKLLCWVPSFS